MPMRVLVGILLGCSLVVIWLINDLLIGFSRLFFSIFILSIDITRKTDIVVINNEMELV